MKAMGVDVTIFNLPERRPQFERSYPDLDLPVVYGRPEELARVATRVDAVIATAWESVEWLLPLSSGRAVCGYYVQDFEPYFHADAEQRRRAHASYSLIPGIVRFTKTPWTRDEVFRQTGVHATVVGVSADIDLFRPRPRSTPEWPHRPLRIGAMIRPESEYRAPRLTMEVLRHAQRRFGDRVDVLLFGTEATNSAFLTLPRDFNWRLAGVLNQNQVAAFLNDLDVFVDFSAYQAMGLTALEAMACGAAVLAPQRGGATSYLRHGENGFLVDTSSADACWQALQVCVEDTELRARVQRQALSDVCAFYPERAALNILAALFARSDGNVA
jgi:hypothetical protein